MKRRGTILVCGCYRSVIGYSASPNRQRAKGGNEAVRGTRDGNERGKRKRGKSGLMNAGTNEIKREPKVGGVGGESSGGRTTLKKQGFVNRQPLEKYTKAVLELDRRLVVSPRALTQPKPSRQELFNIELKNSLQKLVVSNCRRLKSIGVAEISTACSNRCWSMEE